MSEKTLQQVGQEAKDHYDSHKHDPTRLEDAQWDAGVARYNAKPENAKPENAEAIGIDLEHSEKSLNRVKQAIEENTEKRAEFAKNNADQLRELALIEAHLGGIAINVKQPVEIGQRVEVHTSDKKSQS